MKKLIATGLAAGLLLLAACGPTPAPAPTPTKTPTVAALQANEEGVATQPPIITATPTDTPLPSPTPSPTPPDLSLDPEGTRLFLVQVYGGIALNDFLSSLYPGPERSKLMPYNTSLGERYFFERTIYDETPRMVHLRKSPYGGLEGPLVDGIEYSEDPKKYFLFMYLPENPQNKNLKPVSDVSFDLFNKEGEYIGHLVSIEYLVLEGGYHFTRCPPNNQSLCNLDEQ